MAELLELGFSKTLVGYGQGNGDPAWSAAFTKTVFVKRGLHRPGYRSHAARDPGGLGVGPV